MYLRPYGRTFGTTQHYSPQVNHPYYYSIGYNSDRACDQLDDGCVQTGVCLLVDVED